MNTKNNRRRRSSCNKIEGAFLELIQGKEINQITVAEICKNTGLNRSTFYANFQDVYDLADKIREKLEQEVSELYENDLASSGMDYLKLFTHIRDNQLFYNTYFKLGFDSCYIVDTDQLGEGKKAFPEEVLRYHIEFHRAGLNAIIKMWLRSGCTEPPETMVQILKSEYERR